VARPIRVLTESRQTCRTFDLEGFKIRADSSPIHRCLLRLGRKEEKLHTLSAVYREEGI